MPRPNDFSTPTKQKALARQQYQCASCGVRISHLGNACAAVHVYGEAAHAHHIQHLNKQGSDSLDNCVILCEACHYSAHEGGNYRRGTVIGRKIDFPFIRDGKK